MPIHVEVFHPDQIAVVVARGQISIDDYQKFLMEIVQAGLLHYRKIVDVTSADSDTVGVEHLLAFDVRLSAGTQSQNLPRGPLAIVTRRERDWGATTFRDASSKDRPVEVFKTIREARNWLLAQPVRQPPRRATSD